MSLALGADLVGGLRVHPERMRANLDAQGGYVDAERVMLELAQRVGNTARTSSSTAPRWPDSRRA